MKPKPGTAIQTDLRKLQTRIGKRQQQCDRNARQGDLDAARMYEQDVKDLTDMLNLIAAGTYTAAWDLVCALDTEVREQIPVRLFNFLAQENGFH